jgi:AmmeMemoRadiSam system protein A
MMAAEYLGANEVRLLKYANSGDVPAGDKSRVVGYSAFAFIKSSKEKKMEEEFSLDKKAQQVLLDIARKSVEIAVKENKVYEPSSQGIKSIEQDRGAFVTLKINGQLRGCIGYTAPIKPLYLAVRDVAIQAATGDPRFRPVSVDELPLLQYEISVLSPFHHVRNIDEIKIGRDGLLIKKGPYAGLLLPQVPVEWGWDRKTFLEQTCKKAGLPPDAWKDPEADLFRFSAFVFGEE